MDELTRLFLPAERRDTDFQLKPLKMALTPIPLLPSSSRLPITPGVPLL